MNAAQGSSEFGTSASEKSERTEPAAAQRHRGVSLWRDMHDKGHFVLVVFGRWYLHLYAKRVPGYRTHLNQPYPEFKRLPV